jgi:hypothetical protein
VVRDPYARWCGRGGTARCPPIPIRRASVVEIGIGGEQVEDEAFYDATFIAAMRIGCLPGNARNAVAMAAIAANTQADRKT